MDISNTIEADSTQVNAVDLTGSSRIVTITGVTAGPDRKQPVNMQLSEFPGRDFRPCKSMRRILIQAWGPDAKAYVGRRMELFNDESVKWGGKAIGGIRIKALSDIPGRFEKTLPESQKAHVTYVIEKLPDAPPAITEEAVAEFEQRITDATTIDELKAVSAELKALNLGAYKKPLLAAWSARQSEIKAEGADQ